MKFSITKYEPQFRRTLLLVILYLVPAFIILRSPTIDDTDVWWHLRTGQWIVGHQWVPYNDWFSNSGMGKPWAAYSWLFEILIYGLVTRLGLIGLVVYVWALMLAIATALHSFIRKFQPQLAYSVGITALALLALGRLYTPRPWLFTILFFIIELNVLASVRRSRNYRTLLILPLLFALWANIHIQFIYGLFVLGLAAIEGPITRLLGRQATDETENENPLPLHTALLVTAACVAATLVNPYHVRIYAVVLDTLRLGGLYAQISELQAIEFRSAQDWLVLILTLGAAFALGRRRVFSLFWVPLFLTTVYVSFRSGRDSWFVTVVAAAIIAASLPLREQGRATNVSKATTIVLALIIGATIGLFIWNEKYLASELQKGVDRNFPVRAAEYVEAQGYPGPLYNHFDWGGYLIWRLPSLPVSIDGRSNIHRPEQIIQARRVWNGEVEWASDPQLAAARIVIAEKQFPLTQLLRSGNRFQLVYEDEVAVVFTAK